MFNARLTAFISLLFTAILLLLMTYWGAYFLTQKGAATGTNSEGTFTVRTYPTEWHVVLFSPAAAIESAISRRDIQVEYNP
jgi:hypothetical protein